MTNPNDSVHALFDDMKNEVSSGLTKREYFAAIALQGLLSIYTTDGDSIVPNKENTTYMAQLSVTAADELIKALNQLNK